MVSAGSSASEGIKALLEERLYLYDVLRRTFLEEPSREFLQALQENKVLELFPFREEDEDIQEGLRQAQKDLAENNLLEDQQFESLQWDYTKMFIGPYKLPAPPWETAYLTEERLLFQEETLDVRRRYLAYNFLPQNYPHEADDHIGLMLDFMYRLTELALKRYEAGESDAARQILMDQESFLQEHLLNWVPRLAQDVIEHAEHDFYRGMARVLRGSLRVDLEGVAELVAAL